MTAFVRRLTLRQEIADSWRFLRRPTLAGRFGPREGGRWADWYPHIGLGRLMAWAGLLWLVNLFVLGPIAISAAGAGGAQHRMDLRDLPWVAAIFWAPVVEEMLFRYGLRRPLQALWVVPLMALAVYWGPRDWTLFIAAIVVLAAVWLSGRRARWSMTLGRSYCAHYGWVFHLAALAFAGVHLNNFALNQMPLWLLPLLVLPQWLTGLVLGWMRTRRGIGACFALHAVFNAGPMLLISLLLTLQPSLAP